MGGFCSVSGSSGLDWWSWLFFGGGRDVAGSFWWIWGGSF